VFSNGRRLELALFVGLSLGHGGLGCHAQTNVGSSVEPSPPAAVAKAGEDAHATSTASEVPSTDIYLGSLRSGEQGWRLEDIRNLTAREGYDNQPAFTPDGQSLLYTSVRSGQSDIYRRDLGAGGESQVTDTPANEFSPTPLGEGSAISVIRELGGIQQLWRYGIDGHDGGQLFTELDRVGYHLWLGPKWAAFFLVGAGEGENELVHAKAPGASTTFIAEAPGRCIALIPGERAMSFAQGADTESGAAGTIMRFSLESGEASEITTGLPGSEDYAWTPGGALLMGRGSQLERWTRAEGWQELTMVPKEGHELPANRISRIAVSPDGERVAFVVVNATP
jgi:hypothetical protein